MIKEQTYIKKDTSENWIKAKNFIPKENEVILYTDLGTIKIGNGKNKLDELSFIDLNNYSVDGTTLVIETQKILGGGN